MKASNIKSLVVTDFTTRLTEFARMVLDKTFTETILQMLGACTSCLTNGGTIFICGNGGSYSQCLHFAAELTGRFLSSEDSPKNCRVLGSNSSHITAVSNDFGYEYIFSRELDGSCTDRDLLIVLSTSGKSNNVLEALKVAKTHEMTTIGLFGQSKVSGCDICLYVDNGRSDIVQEVHLIVLHTLAKYITLAFGYKGSKGHDEEHKMPR